MYVSETVCTVDDTKDEVRFVTAKTADVASLMQGLFHTMQRVERDRVQFPEHVDCVVATAMLGFGLVFIHPFDDGNGRAHRFLIQQILRRLGYVPDMIFPVSNIMVRRRGQYEVARPPQAPSRSPALPPAPFPYFPCPLHGGAGGQGCP